MNVPLKDLRVSAYQIPTDGPESDGTAEWSATTLVLVEARADGRTGLGYTYADVAAARLIADQFVDLLRGRDAFAIPAAFHAMHYRTRNLGRPGLVQMAISAVDSALWDLKARLLDTPLVSLLGQFRESVPIYGSGGFTSYSEERLCKQLAGWVEQGISRVKMKIGRQPENDPRRVRAARQAIGPDAELFVDANGAYDRKQALQMAEAFADCGVTWFEEPVSSDDLEGLRMLRDRAPAGMEIAAGEYGYDQFYFRRMLDAGAVDALQADITRCGGVTGFLAAGVLCEAHAMPLSAHTAPFLHLHPACASPAVRHVEYFYDDLRIVPLLFDGVPEPVGGALRPDLSRPGHGLELKRSDAERHRIWAND